MSVTDALDLVVRVSFVALGVRTIIDYLRHRDAIRRDVALLFSLLAVPFLIQLGARVTGTEISSLANQFAIVGLILEPYLVLRLVRYLRSMPDRMLRYALYGMLTTVVVGSIFGPRIPIISIVVSQGYLIGCNLYAMVGFVRGALRATGVARQRLRCAAAGSGLFALALGAALLAVAISQLEEFFVLLVQILALASAVAFYIGFVPPRWLRRIWQLRELRDYLLEATHNLPTEQTGVANSLKRLCRSANQAVGAMAAGVIQWNGKADTWELRESTDHVILSNVLANGEQVIKRAMQKQAPSFIYVPDVKDESERKQLTSVGAGTWLFIPMTVNEHAWGILLVLLRGRSLFMEDDLNLLGLLAQENAIILTNYQLIAELQGYSEQLERKVEERTAALHESERRYRELNMELEQRVHERTVQLEAVNKELEAFSYSVSHDLRAPLRAMDGFSRVLEKNYAERLDEKGIHYLDRIRASSQRMGQLIDGLLELSRLTRSDMHREQVDLGILAGQIVSELREEYPGREVEFKVEDELVVTGDIRLLRVALSNLLSNAWKYTAKQPAPRVELGVTEYEGRRAFFVRDNGAGFDMAYADKLFGVFERLHGENEFPGSGIGLATVQRIVTRHGGSIWADGAVNQGATFYFSL